ncbi:hypothetical protein [Pseudomonas huanghezhanensis]|uniref:hypothetical protein n=1 Tax=Pseudomonas huanghezhanensis TaxID=3002903 RepID=UPI002285A24C|nr:hypothetical protein [Pseudomonas sp. BSw22131]
MTKQRRSFSAEFKCAAALAANASSLDVAFLLVNRTLLENDCISGAGGNDVYGFNLQESWTVMIPTPSWRMFGEESRFQPYGF